MNLKELAARVIDLGVQGKRLAIIDDDPQVLAVFEETYRRLGLQVQIFKYPEATAEFWNAAENFDFVLVDHSLGGSNGANVAANLLKNGKVKAKIFIFTGYLRDDYKEFKSYYSKTELIQKPLDIFDTDMNYVEQAVETSVLMQVDVSYA